LDIPAGTAIQFEGSDTKEVTLVAIAENGMFMVLTTVVPSTSAKTEALECRRSWLRHGTWEDTCEKCHAIAMLSCLDTTGDRIRLGDTSLIVSGQRHHGLWRRMCFGGGKTLRDGLGLAPELTAADGALDLVITNVVLMDPVLGNCENGCWDYRFRQPRHGPRVK